MLQESPFNITHQAESSLAPSWFWKHPGAKPRHKQNTGLSVNQKDLCLVSLMHSSHFSHRAVLQEPQPVPAAGSWGGAWSSPLKAAFPMSLFLGWAQAPTADWRAGQTLTHAAWHSTVTTLRAATYFGHFTSRQLRKVKWKLPPAPQTNAININELNIKHNLTSEHLLSRQS